MVFFFVYFLMNFIYYLWDVLIIVFVGNINFVKIEIINSIVYIYGLS